MFAETPEARLAALAALAAGVGAVAVAVWLSRDTTEPVQQEQPRDDDRARAKAKGAGGEDRAAGAALAAAHTAAVPAVDKLKAKFRLKKRAPRVSEVEKQANADPLKVRATIGLRVIAPNVRCSPAPVYPTLPSPVSAPVHVLVHVPVHVAEVPPSLCVHCLAAPAPLQPSPRWPQPHATNANRAVLWVFQQHTSQWDGVGFDHRGCYAPPGGALAVDLITEGWVLRAAVRSCAHACRSANT